MRKVRITKKEKFRTSVTIHPEDALLLTATGEVKMAGCVREKDELVRFWKGDVEAWVWTVVRVEHLLEGENGE